MYIVFVEDDHLQMEDIEVHVKEAFPGATVERVNTEGEFVSRIDEIADRMPAMVVVDMLLRWADPSPTRKAPPEEVKKGGFFRAGIRCVERLLANEKTKNVPILIYTVLEESDLAQDLSRLPPTVSYLRKDLMIEPLISKMRNLLSLRTPR